MHLTGKLSRQRSAWRPIAGHLRRFARDEAGVMVAFVVCLLLIMLLVGGMGVDFMRHETQRARIQSVLDRAILAAADMDQEMAPRDVVADYFAKSGMGNYLAEVVVDEGASYRIVKASANTQMKTQFLGTIGYPTFDVRARGTAEESIGAAEVSLVLDISGSMGEDQRMSRLRTAAKEFLDTVLLEDKTGAVSVSLVPYSSQVNAGPAIFDRLNIKRVHGYSSCVNFADEDFSTTTITTTQEYQQGEHFQNYSTYSPIVNPGCPMREYEEIYSFSQNKVTMKARVDQFQNRANTSIHIGMKWGTALVDPSMRPVVDDMIDAGLVNAEFKGRPQPYENGVLKTVILMTDGENVPTMRIRDAAYSTPAMRYHWHRNALMTWISDHVDDTLANEFYYVRSTATEADTLLQNICKAARDAGIVVWTVGFEVGNHGAAEMEKCASSPSHFFRVEGIEISEAFRSIARQLNPLKLTQ